ncbi:OprD family porin [Sansalvadorimonas sp. 2012CJ34-2]|uniref:OprD family porin n=1 Tax=Parendozoicomonas callyspongiae TaxID=2942213 RepID=A0ABT0PBR5_9GAMM|nr:OprD family outer membrane porin [Sansalvadorimonas sp. 2012CJ34-2]MCL6268820.1 OprD family porin [Sansalvadorimonas sp. 2012CJ34-2]
MLRKTTTLATAISAITLAMSVNTFADSHAADGVFDGAFKSSWDQFVEDSSFDYRVRLSHFDLSPHRGDITHQLTRDEISALESLGQVPAGTTAVLDNPLVPDANKQAAIAQISQGASADATAGVKKDGDVRETGVGLWTHFKSGYLFDFIGFDLGTNSGKVIASPGTGSKLAPDAGSSTMSRIAIANVKLRYGDEDRYIGLRHGKMQLGLPHFFRDPNEWLLDHQYKGTMIDGKWDKFYVYGLDLEAYSDVNKKKFIDINDVSYFNRANFDSTYSLGSDYKSDYGTLTAETTWSDNYMRSNLMQVETGLPLAKVGMNVPDNMDHMLILVAQHSWQKAEKDFVNQFGKHLPDHKSTTSEVLLGMQYDALFVGASVLQIGDKGFFHPGIGKWNGGLIDILTDETLINEWNQPNQRTISFAIDYNWKNFGVPEFRTGMITSHASKIDMDQVLKNGDAQYYLTGKDKYKETIFEAEYKWQDGPLEGLGARVSAGWETNQAELKGFGAFITYDAALF